MKNNYCNNAILKASILEEDFIKKILYPIIGAVMIVSWASSALGESAQGWKKAESSQIPLLGPEAWNKGRDMIDPSSFNTEEIDGQITATYYPQAKPKSTNNAVNEEVSIPENSGVKEIKISQEIQAEPKKTQKANEYPQPDEVSSENDEIFENLRLKMPVGTPTKAIN
ncbi:MAG: hypothetical protein JW734_06860 [Candidatus Omnitrophica bacterium]|nr:hypothetical protein [Candidatus Omnitrophota bacterium]